MIDCGNPPVITNGDMITSPVSSTLYEAQVEYECITDWWFQLSPNEYYSMRVVACIVDPNNVTLGIWDITECECESIILFKQIHTT